MSDKKIVKPEENKGLDYWEVALEAVVAATPLIGAPVAAIIRASKDSERASETNDLQVLTEEAARQRVELQMAEMQAKVAQEMAIAQRIQSAAEVEIEEYYEGTGEGNVGIKTKDGAISLGASAKGNKVTKRIYRFKGYSDKVIEHA